MEKQRPKTLAEWAAERELDSFTKADLLAFIRRLGGIVLSEGAIIRDLIRIERERKLDELTAKAKRLAATPYGPGLAAFRQHCADLDAIGKEQDALIAAIERDRDA